METYEKRLFSNIHSPLWTVADPTEALRGISTATDPRAALFVDVFGLSRGSTSRGNPEAL